MLKIRRLHFAICKGSKRRLMLVLAVAIIFLILQYLWTKLPSDINNEVFLYHFRRSRNLDFYLKSIEAKTLPLYPCGRLQVRIPVVILVSSAPTHYRQREVIRNTWGKYHPTYFVLGMNHTDPITHYMTKTYAEFKVHDDLIIYSFQDHYQNLTLKTALMMQWTLQQCPLADFMFKVDDDVLVVPWRLNELLQDHANHSIIGYKVQDANAHRNPYSKWYLPRWLYHFDYIAEYLSGASYLINTKALYRIFNAAKQVPLINLEDVFFSSIIARHTLKLNLIHDDRLSPFLPMYPATCIYWNYASIHTVGLGEEGVTAMWKKIHDFHDNVMKNNTYGLHKLICSFFYCVFLYMVKYGMA